MHLIPVIQQNTVIDCRYFRVLTKACMSWKDLGGNTLKTKEPTEIAFVDKTTSKPEVLIEEKKKRKKS